MDRFFKVKTLEQVLDLLPQFPTLDIEKIDLESSYFRVLAEDIEARENIPGFRRSTMDGYAVHSSSTFGASEANPAWLDIAGSIPMGTVPQFSITPGQAAKISTGGMLPDGADSVVMVEHTEQIDNSAVEIYKSAAPLLNVIDYNEDFSEGERVLSRGTFLRAQEVGLAAALGITSLPVYRVPSVGIISTGDEIVPAAETPPPGRIRDINSYTLSGAVAEAGCRPVCYGIVSDSKNELLATCQKAIEETDMVLISGGSSVGVRDFTVEALSSIENTSILVHGISISPGKPTILAKVGGKKPVWGLPGHVVSAMVVFKIVVLPFLKSISGRVDSRSKNAGIEAKLSRNIASAQGRSDFVRVKLVRDADGTLSAVPLLGKSGLIRTMVMADGLLEIPENDEGIEKDQIVTIIPMF